MGSKELDRRGGWTCLIIHPVLSCQAGKESLVEFDEEFVQRQESPGIIRKEI